MGTFALRMGRRILAPGALALLLLTLVPLGAGVASAASPTWSASCDVNLRSRPTTLSTKRTEIAAKTVVTISGTVKGGSYASPCPKATVYGGTWLAITAIGGKSVRSLLGVTTVYAASGLFKAVGVAAPPGTVEGIDISRWNGRVDFKRVRGAGIQFVIAKATEGRLYTDDAYARNRSGALAAGLAFTAYHFARPDTTYHDAIREADHFLAVAGLRHGMLAPVLDLESAGKLGPAALQRWVKAWLGRVYARIGVRAIIYTNPSFWLTAMGDTRWFATNGYGVLWIANWHVAAPTLPAADWSGRSWGLWQYSSCGRVAGVAHCVDRDRLNGSDLARLRF